MKTKLLIPICLLILALCFTACGKDDTSGNMVTGMVTAVDGTTISLMQMDTQNMQRPSDFEGGERPSGWGEGEMPSFDGERPSWPEDGTMPSSPTDGERPSFDGEMPSGQWPGNGEMPDFGNMSSFGGETTQYDIANAHISVEIDGGKATGSMEDVTVGSRVTLTLNKKGEVTNVLVSSSGFGGSFGGFGGFGGGFGGGNRGEGKKDSQTATEAA